MFKLSQILPSPTASPAHPDLANENSFKSAFVPFQPNSNICIVSLYLGLRSSLNFLLMHSVGLENPHGAPPLSYPGQVMAPISCYQSVISKQMKRVFHLFIVQKVWSRQWLTFVQQLMKSRASITVIAAGHSTALGWQFLF